MRYFQFFDSLGSLRQLFTHYYGKIRRHPIHNFWKDVVQSADLLELANENNFPSKTDVSVTEPPEPSAEEAAAACSAERLQALIVNSVSVSDSDNESDCFTEDRLRVESDRELFCLGRPLGTHDYTGQRVLQIATILKNLSFIEENVAVLSQNHTFLRFLLLCVGSRWGNLHTLGLEMLGNISGEFLLKDLNRDRLARNLLKLVTEGLQSEDRNFCISCLDVLNKLSQTEANEDILARTLEPVLYQRVCSFLTIHDVMLLIYTLECLYSLSSLGERPCNLIVNNHGVVDTLVSLVTVEGKSYGPKACIGMKLVETLPGGTVPTAATTNSPTVTTTAAQSTTTSAPASPAKSVTTPARPALQRLMVTPSPTPLSRKYPAEPHPSTFLTELISQKSKMMLMLQLSPRRCPRSGSKCPHRLR